MIYYYTTTELASTSVFLLWLSIVLVILVHDSLVNHLVCTLRENSNCTEELIASWVNRGVLVCLFASPLTLSTTELLVLVFSLLFYFSFCERGGMGSCPRSE